MELLTVAVATCCDLLAEARHSQQRVFDHDIPTYFLLLFFSALFVQQRYNVVAATSVLWYNDL